MEPLDLVPTKRRKRRRWPWVVALLLPILGYAGYIGYQEYEVYHRPLLLTEVPKDVLVKQPEIAYAGSVAGTCVPSARTLKHRSAAGMALICAFIGVP